MLYYAMLCYAEAFMHDQAATAGVYPASACKGAGINHAMVGAGINALLLSDNGLLFCH